MNPSYNPAEVFLQEAEELLAQVEEIALEIGSGPDSTEKLNRLFRVFHTIKGSGSMFGFTAVAEFTHHVETALDEVREGRLGVSPELVALILAARDHIVSLLAAAQKGWAFDASTGGLIVTELQALRPAGVPAEPSAGASAPIEDPANKSTAACTYHVYFRPNPDLLTAGTDPQALLDELRGLGECTVCADTSAVPVLGKIQPDGCYLAWNIVLTTDRGLAAVRDLFIFVEDGAELRIEEAAVARPATSAAGAPEPVPPPALSAGPATVVPPAPVVESPMRPVAATPTEPAAPGKAAPRSVSKSAPVRVASERLDLLVNLVGELVMAQSRIAQVAAQAGVAPLSTPVEDLERIVAAMRDAVLGIRMMPIGATFNRYKRLVHDLSAELGKEIDLRMEGAETELDKTVLDQLGDPLVHLIRNCIDHGVEPPEERERQGKPRRAIVRLSATHAGSHVVVAIHDDGRGLNLAAIRAKAIERKLITAEAPLSEKETINLIFLPGFSTAKQVTSVSGRGVGMDVVRRMIEALRGTIQITTRAGQGTSVALSLPLTLAIIEGQLAEIGTDQFIVPMAAVAENIELEPGQRTRRNGRNVVTVRGELIPYIRLRELFEIRTPAPDTEMAVIVSYEDQRVGLVVDRVLGSHQTVIQPLGPFYRQIEVASGATIMGDGRVALILDLAGLVRAVSQDRPEIPARCAAPVPETA